MDIFCRGVKPFPTPSLAEVLFWLRIMRDHAQFVDSGLPCAESGLKIEAQKFAAVFGDLEERVAKDAPGEEFSRLIAATTQAVGKFFAFKRHILHLLIDCRLCGSWLTPLFVDHMSREALYFRKLLKKITGCAMAFPVDAVVSENVFWVRGTADHFKFIRGLADPAERGLVSRAKVLGDKFDVLNLQVRDFAGILWHYRPTNELVRLEVDLRVASGEAVDFFTAAESLTARCAAATVIPPLLAGHIRRESEHWLAVLEIIRRFLLQDGEELDDDDEDEDD